jgi:hypothetical protein
VLRAEEPEAVPQPEPAGEGLGRGALGPLPHHQQHRVHLADDPLEDAHDVEHALDGPEVRDVEQHLLPKNGEPRPVRPLERVLLEVDEVRDDVDRLRDLERFARHPLQEW